MTPSILFERSRKQFAQICCMRSWITARSQSHHTKLSSCTEYSKFPPWAVNQLSEGDGRESADWVDKFHSFVWSLRVPLLLSLADPASQSQAAPTVCQSSQIRIFSILQGHHLLLESRLPQPVHSTIMRGSSCQCRAQQQCT